MEDFINVVVRNDEELTAEEVAVVMEALKLHYDLLNETPQGDKGKAATLLSAATKIGFYTPD